MISGELLSVLESIVTRVVRVRSGYKRRADGSIRAFGGINLLVFGDWWQIAPVGGTAIFANPLTTGTWKGMDIFWSSGRDTIRQLWEFTKPMRCPDQWYNYILTMFRQGTLGMDDYSMLHGLPTSTPGSWDPVYCKTSCPCGEDVKLLQGTTDVHYKQ